MAQKGQKQEGMSWRNKRGCNVAKYLLCVVSTHKGIAPYPYIWQQHVANQ